VLTLDGLGYSLEVARIKGSIHSISLPNGLEVVNNHHIDYSSFMCMWIEDQLMELGLFGCFLWDLGLIISVHKITTGLFVCSTPLTRSLHFGFLFT